MIRQSTIVLLLHLFHDDRHARSNQNLDSCTCGNDSNTGAHVRPHSHSLYCGEECTRSCVDVCTSDKCSIRPSLVSRTCTPPVLDCLQCDH